MSAIFNVVFYADCKHVGCDVNLKALSGWCMRNHGKKYMRWTIYAEPVMSLKDIPQFLKELKKTPLRIGAITLAAGHGPPGGGTMQVGNDNAVQARHFGTLPSVSVPWLANPVVYLNACYCAKGAKGLALCRAVGKYFRSGRTLTVIGPVKSMIGTPPPILSTAAASIRKVICR